MTWGNAIPCKISVCPQAWRRLEITAGLVRAGLRVSKCRSPIIALLSQLQMASVSVELFDENKFPKRRLSPSAPVFYPITNTPSLIETKGTL